MSEQKRLINEKIKLISTRRDYYTDSSYNYYPNNEMKDIEVEEVKESTEISKVKIAETPVNYKNNTSDINEKVENTKEKAEPNNTIKLSNAAVKDKDIFKNTVDPIAAMYPSYVRFYSLIPDDEEISVASKDKEMCKNLKRNTPSEYLNLEPGIYDMHFYDNNNTLLYEYKLKAFNCAITTLIITKTNNEYSVFALKGTTTDCFSNSSYVRFIQTVPRSPAMDIYIDGIPVILGITYNEISVFIGLPAGIHNITVTAAATSVIYIDRSFNFSSESLNDMFIVSDATGLYDLSILTNEDSCL